MSSGIDNTNYIITNQILNDLDEVEEEKVETEERDKKGDEKGDEKAKNPQKLQNKIVGKTDDENAYFDNLGSEQIELPLDVEDRPTKQKDPNQDDQVRVQGKVEPEKENVKNISFDSPDERVQDSRSIRPETSNLEGKPETEGVLNVVDSSKERPQEVENDPSGKKPVFEKKMTRKQTQKQKKSIAMFIQKELENLNKIREIELKNETLTRSNELLKEKNQKLEEKVNVLEEDQKKSNKKLDEMEMVIVKSQEEVSSYEKQLELFQKELEIYKDKVEVGKSKIQESKTTSKKLKELEDLLETKNGRIAELEVELKSLPVRSTSSSNQVSRSCKNFELSPLSLIWDKQGVSSPRNLEKKKEQSKDELGEPSKVPVESQDQQENPIDLIKKKIEKLDNSSKQEDLILQPKLVTSGVKDEGPTEIFEVQKTFKQDQIKKLKTITEEASKKKEANEKAGKPSNQMRPSYQLKMPKNTGMNSKINKKSKELRQVMKTHHLEAKRREVKNIIRYNHDHLNVLNYPKLVRLIEKTEGVNMDMLLERNEFHCLSDNVYRLNRWKNKKLKKLIVTQKYLYLITPPHEVKRVLKLSEIEQIKTRGNQDNFICFITLNKNDEMLDCFKKNELLLFLMQLIRRQRLPIQVHSNTKSFVMLNTSNKNMVVDPNALDKFRPIYNNTFNYASRHNKLMNVYVWKEGVFVSKNYQKKVALITDLGLLLFSKIKWDLERFVPFGGRPVNQRRQDLGQQERRAQVQVPLVRPVRVEVEVRVSQ